MRIFKSTLARLSCLFAAAPQPPSSRPTAHESVAGIQQSMLDALRPAAGECFGNVMRRIAAAEDPQALWFLRPDLMAALASCLGEVEAHEAVNRISAQFRGLLPQALAARHSPLAQCADPLP